MRILELGKFYPPERGGMETLLQIWAEGFRDQGAQVTCVVANRTPDSVIERQPGLEIHRLASRGQLLSTSLCPQYPGATRRFHADVIHAHFPNPLADLAVIRAPKDVPVVVHWHSDIVRQKAILRLYKPIQDAMLRRADRIVVATPQHLEYSDWLGPWRHKVEVIPFGLDLDRFAKTPAIDRKAATFREGVGNRIVFLNIGRLVGYKGQRYAIEALQSVPSALLWLVGTGPLEAELKQLATQLGVSDRVRFWGDVPDADLPALLHACDVFLFPSITPNEAFGLVLVEAMACAKPLVACNLRSGVPYVCRSEDNGLVVPAMDPASLASAMEQLIESPDLRHRLGQRGQLRAQGEFSKRSMIDRHLSLFRKLGAKDSPA
jgi:rhamnosyl/mannosyltransferase